MRLASGIRTVACWAAVFSLPIAAQPNRPTARTKKSTLEVAKCHAQLGSLEGKTSADFDGKSLAELTALFDSIDVCVRDWYPDLPKFDLVLATVVTGWLQSAIDTQSVMCEGRGYAGPSIYPEESPTNTSSQPPATNKSPDVEKPQLTSGRMSFFPLNVGDWYFGVFGNCSTKTTETMSCYESGSSVAVSYIAAIVAQNGREYLVGCKSDFREGIDQRCFSLTPGVYNGIVHDTTLTIPSTGRSTVVLATGQDLGEMTAVYSILKNIK